MDRAAARNLPVLKNGTIPPHDEHRVGSFCRFLPFTGRPSADRGSTVVVRGVMLAFVDAERYHRLQLVLGLAGLGLTVAYLLACLVAGAGPALARFAQTIDVARWWQVAVVAIVVGAGHAIV